MFSDSTRRSAPSFLLLALAAALIGLGSCSSAPTAIPYPSGSIPSDEAASLSARLKDDRTQQVDILAPNSFANAQKHFDDAQSKIQDQAKAEKTLDELAESRAWLGRAEDAATANRKAAPELLMVRSDAQNADSPSLAPGEWKTAEEHMQKQMKKQESHSDRVLSADDRKEIQDDYVLAQRQALKVKNLTKAKEIVKTLKDEGAEKLIPSALTHAQGKIVEAEGIIDANRNESGLIANATDLANHSALEARDLFDRAKTVKSGTPEDAAMALRMKDRREEGLNRDLHQTKGDLDQTKGDLEKEHQTLVENSKELSKSQQDTAILSSQAAAERKVATLQDRFDSDQAEVFQQGDDVLIRLKGVGFATGSAKIPKKSDDLLNDVKDVIAEYPGAAVTVEGHTDSVGTETTNRKLSQARADSVKKYLIQEEATSPNLISSQGFAADKPIASDKTASGREKNRRVDIIIKGAVSATSAVAPTGHL